MCSSGYQNLPGEPHTPGGRVHLHRTHWQDKEQQAQTPPKRCFPAQVSQHWHWSLREAVVSPSVEIFQTQLDASSATCCGARCLSREPDQNSRGTLEAQELVGLQKFPPAKIFSIHLPLLFLVRLKAITSYCPQVQDLQDTKLHTCP